MKKILKINFSIILFKEYFFIIIKILFFVFFPELIIIVSKIKFLF